MLKDIFTILVFPGFCFLLVAGWFFQYFDRKLYARFQNRIGPPWFQPFADFVKLLGKEDIVPKEADPYMFPFVPVVALTGVLTAILYIPLWETSAAYSFSGDLIVVLYLLTLPTFTFFLAGWYSSSLFSVIGAMRSQMQFFAYEVPLFLAILAPALIANTWSLSEMTVFYSTHSGYWIFNIVGFVVAIICLLGKLEKVPFDTPDAETEIVGGPFTEYSGRYLAFFKLAMDVELVVVAALIAAVFLPFGLSWHPAIGILFFLVKISFVIVLTTAARAMMARLRIDQMIEFCWIYLAPAALIQVLFNLGVKGVAGL
ncbi:MAG: NADH-quinone oxidoreductase subunit H [Candidatus Riflebacteria bacterium]|nr:NADH-quinone oxidoreductase subunit H [Candidatus Riflebacteria bacterium]